jgi:hypothetical protein
MAVPASDERRCQGVRRGGRMTRRARGHCRRERCDDRRSGRRASCSEQ